MPRKRNRRKEYQAKKRDARPKAKRVIMIDPVPSVSKRAKLSAALLAPMGLDAFESLWARREADYPEYLSLVEGKIIARLLDTILSKDDHQVSVEDEEGEVQAMTNDRAAIESQIGHTGQTVLMVWRKPSPANAWRRVGWVSLIHGNEYDVISDHTDNPGMEELVRPASDLATALQ